MFVGVGLASLPVLWFDVSPTLAVAVGAAAGMAAQTRLLFAPVLFATCWSASRAWTRRRPRCSPRVAAWLAMGALEPEAADAQ